MGMDNDIDDIKGISIGGGDFNNTINITVNDGDTYWGTDLSVVEGKKLVELLQNKIKQIEEIVEQLKK